MKRIAGTLKEADGKFELVGVDRVTYKLAFVDDAKARVLMQAVDCFVDVDGIETDGELLVHKLWRLDWD